MRDWFDDQWWWHRICGHAVAGPVVGDEEHWFFWAHVCEDCDYSWIR